jgi:tripartite-type tricarboxylate transporter receptor subunit TctC
MIRLAQLCAGALVAATLSYSPASAQNYPDKPIRVIVSIAAGSVTDVIMRAAAKEIEGKLGQPLVIENRGGAAGILAGQSCAQSAGDGYTLCVIYHSTMSYNPVQFDKLPYNADELVPVTRLFFLTEGLFVNADVPAKTVAALKTLAQQKPEGLNFATLGNGSFPDLFRVWLNNQWGTKIVGVPYKGGGPAAQALAANEVQVTRFGVGNFRGLMEAGKVRMLAIAADQRSKQFPEVPTFREAGLNYPGQGWWGLAAPKGTPASIVDKVSVAFVSVFGDPTFAGFLEKQLVVPAATGPADFAKFLKEDRKAAEDLVKIANAPKQDYKPQ